MCISERLRQVCEAKNWKITDFADQAGIAYRTMQGYIGGEREPNAEGMTGIAKAGVNLNWLVSGEGEMFTNNTEIIDLTQLEKELLASYQSCDNSTQRKINLAISAIAQDKE
jgi:bacteriophage CI repressor helix-turn-helix domain